MIKRAIEFDEAILQISLAIPDSGIAKDLKILWKKYLRKRISFPLFASVIQLHFIYNLEPNIDRLYQELEVHFKKN